MGQPAERGRLATGDGKQWQARGADGLGDGNGVAGHPLPADPLVHGFAVARLHGRDVLVRPDRYVARWLEGDAEAALPEILRAPSCT